MGEVKMKGNKIRKFCVIFFMFVITAAVCGASYFVATKEFESTKKQLLLQEATTLSTWTQNTVSQINLWTDSLSSQAKRVSTSELYRLFAMDVAELATDQIPKVNSEALSSTSLSEQIPLMRSVLTDFMNLNGYTDARLLDDKGVTFLSAQARPAPIDKSQVEVALRAIKTNKVAFAPITRYQNGVLLHFAEPLASVLSQTGNEQAIATLLLSTPVTAIISRFTTNDSQSEAFSPYIIQQNKEGLEIVDVAKLSFQKVRTPLTYDSDYKLKFKYRESVGNSAKFVWSYGIYLPKLNWWVIAEIPALAIQEKLKKEATKIYGFAATFTVVFMLVLMLLWWIVVGREQKANAKRFESLYELIGDQKRILDNVNAALDTGLLAADVTGKIIMANRAFGDLSSCDYEALAGENIAPIFDSTFTHELLAGIAKASQDSKPLTAEYSAVLGNETRLLRLTFFPFLDNEINEITDIDKENEENSENISAKTPQETAKEKAKEKARKLSQENKHARYENAALITFTDITEFRRQSNAKRHVQEKSMQALVLAVESMDPYLSGHSHRMEELGVLVCKTLQLDNNDLSTVAIAANLSQVGKLFVSRDLLLKKGELTEEEKSQLLSIPEKAWLTLKEIDFQLPVPQAVHDMYERLNGEGYPRQLSGDNIGIHARILGIVNTFCAMTAPRSYRQGINIENALAFLRNDQGYDQKIVDALEVVLNSDEGLEIAKAVLDATSIKI